MADAYYVGQLGTTEFAAVSFVNPVMFLFQAIGMGVQIAGTSILAQLIGRNKQKEAKEYAYHVILFSIYKHPSGSAFLLSVPGTRRSSRNWTIR